MSDGRQFEFSVLRLLRAMDFEVQVTGRSRDGGVDLLATDPKPLGAGNCVVQCKDQSQPVGEPVLRDLYGTMHAQRANKGILVTTSSFTPAAQRFAQGKPLELIDGQAYRDLCQAYGIEGDTETGEEPGVEGSPELDPTSVRITAIECTDAEEERSLHDYVFTIGKFSIGSSISYAADQVGSFALHGVRIVEVRANHSVSFTGEGNEEILDPDLRQALGMTGLEDAQTRSITGTGSELEITFKQSQIEETTYTIRLEGHYDLIRNLEHQATAKIGSAQGNSPKGRPGSSGCLVMLVALAALAAWVTALLR